MSIMSEITVQTATRYMPPLQMARVSPEYPKPPRMRLDNELFWAHQERIMKDKPKSFEKFIEQIEAEQNKKAKRGETPTLF